MSQPSHADVSGDAEMPTSSVNPIRVLIVQGGIGAAWLVGPPQWTDTRAYKPVVALGSALPFYPVRALGAVLIVIAVGLALSLARYRRQTWHWSAALAMFWAFWATLFFFAVVGSSAGLVPVFFSVGFGWYAFERATPPRRRKR